MQGTNLQYKDEFLKQLLYYKAFGYKFINPSKESGSYKKEFDQFIKEIQSCQLCQNAKSRSTIFAPTKSKADIMLIFDSPTKLEDSSAKFLQKDEIGDFLNKEGIFDFYTTFLLKCYNKTQSALSYKKCYPYIYDEIWLLKPSLVITFGQNVANFLLQNTKLPSLEVIHGSLFNLSFGHVIPLFDLHYIRQNPSKSELFYNDLKKAITLYKKLSTK